MLTSYRTSVTLTFAFAALSCIPVWSQALSDRGSGLNRPARNETAAARPAPQMGLQHSSNGWRADQPHHWQNMSDVDLPRSSSATPIFDNGEWVVTLAEAPQIPEAPMLISVDGDSAASAKLVQISNQTEMGGRFPQVAVIASSGFIRLKQGADPEPPIPFGTSVVLGPAYWEAANGADRLHHNPQIHSANLLTDSVTTSGGVLRVDLSGVLGNLEVAYHLRLPAPFDSLTTMFVESSYRATAPIVIDQQRLESREGFRLIQFSSMYLDEQIHDADEVEFVAFGGFVVNFRLSRLFCGHLATVTPEWIEPLSDFFLLHTDDEGFQGNTPSIGIRLLASGSGGNAAFQGFITCDDNPNNDNVGFWMHDEAAPHQLAVGDSGHARFRLTARDCPGIIDAVRSRNITAAQRMQLGVYPNPANPAAQILFYLPRASQVSLNLTDLNGRQVARLLEAMKPAGWHQVSLHNLELSNGVYFISIEAQGNTQTRKLTFIK